MDDSKTKSIQRLIQKSKHILTNGILPVFIIMLWNIALTSKLPVFYTPSVFNANVPFLILLFETLFRIVALILPVFLVIDIKSKTGKLGLIVFSLGALIYFGSWLMLIFVPNSSWSKSLIGFTAPTWTVAIWLIGMGMMFDRSYFKIKYKKWFFIAPSLILLISHIYHSIFHFYRI